MAWRGADPGAVAVPAAGVGAFGGEGSHLSRDMLAVLFVSGLCLGIVLGLVIAFAMLGSALLP